jgi:hypothetical protein
MTQRGSFFQFLIPHRVHNLVEVTLSRLTNEMTPCSLTSLTPLTIGIFNLQRGEIEQRLNDITHALAIGSTQSE